MSKVVVCVGTQKGAFLLSSDDGRKEWNVEGPLLPGWGIRDLCFDTRGDSPVLWAAIGHEVYGPSLQRSVDMGKTWEQIEHGPQYAEDAPGPLEAMWSIVPGRPEEDGILYAGAAQAGLFVTRDGGDHWEELKGLTEHPTRSTWTPGAGGLCCHTIVLDPKNDQRMWVGISAAGCFRTEDGGKSWTDRNEGLVSLMGAEVEDDGGFCVHRMVVDPTNPDRLFQQFHFGVYKSENAGDSWELIENGLPRGNEGCFGFPIEMHPRDPNTLFIFPQVSGEYRYAHDGQLAVYKTTDAGENWSARTKGLPGNAYQGALRQAMCVDTLDACGVYFGTTGGSMFASADEGETWAAMPGEFPRIQSVTASVLED
jgi:photosystem II stability/assembly factor-like uncharacterized protein